MANPIAWLFAPRTRREERSQPDDAAASPDLRVLEGGETELEKQQRLSEERLARRRRRRNRMQRSARRVLPKSPFGLW